MFGHMPESERQKIFATPSVAMCEGKVIKRWDRGGDSHWVIGHDQDIDGVSYKLKDIVRTAGVTYLMCERT
jgi:hypothetical protein